ncbi:MAG: invasion associated locus B family protein [Alphaproteobacteria bacterium]|nr:invasion associated locus B family protein [Alphaproteobacteria bacterium]
MRRLILVLMMAAFPALADDDAPTGVITLYGDWRLACPTDAKTHCIMTAELMGPDKNGVAVPQNLDSSDTIRMTDPLGETGGEVSRSRQTPGRLAQITIGYAAGKTSAPEMIVAVPLTVRLEPGFAVGIDGKRKPVPYATCLPSGCIGIRIMDDATLAELAEASSLGIEVTAESGKVFELPISLHGYRGAYKAMLADEAKRHPK